MADFGLEAEEILLANCLLVVSDGLGICVGESDLWNWGDSCRSQAVILLGVGIYLYRSGRCLLLEGFVLDCLVYSVDMILHFQA